MEVEVKYKVEVEAQSGSGKVCRVEVEVIMTKLNWNDTNGPPYLLGFGFVYFCQGYRLPFIIDVLSPISHVMH